MAYLVLSEHAILNALRTVDLACQPTGDAGAALCDALTFVTGTAIITAFGARLRVND
jgi:hypothetical protein